MPCDLLRQHKNPVDPEAARVQGFRGFAPQQVDLRARIKCLDLGDQYEPAARAFDRFKVIQRAASLGGVESIASLPVLTSQWGYTPDQLMDAGITRGMIRLSVGLEDVKDLIADLDQALG